MAEATKISEYQIKLMEQARGASVPTQRTIPVILYPGESEANDDSTFTRWAHRARRLPSMSALRSSASKADVRLERKLRYEFAKLKAKGQLRSLYPAQYAKPVADPTTTVSTVQTVAGHSALVSEPYTPTSIGGRRVGVQSDPQRDAQKLHRRTGNLAEKVPRTPMSFRLRVSTPLHQILVLNFVMTLL